MPIYEYHCTACRTTFDAMQKFSDAPLTTCRQCNASGHVAKNLTAPGFALKGSGWYATDFKGGNAAAKNTDAKPDAAAPAPAPAAAEASASAAPACGAGACGACS